VPVAFPFHGSLLKGRPAVFLLTVVEARDHFHQVTAVMTGDADERELLERITATFSELR